MLIKFLLYCCVCLNVAHAMAPDGVHTFNDYVELSYENSAFDAACSVTHSSGMSMTGVLIAPQVVLTAAHGIEAIIQKIPPSVDSNTGMLHIPVKNLYVSFKFKDASGRKLVQKIKILSVLLDMRYFESTDQESRSGKFDFALLILEASPVDIKPAELLHYEVLPNDAMMTVVSYGTSDRSILGTDFSNSLMRRAFRLYERDTYYGNGKAADVFEKSRYLQESSLYFLPSELTKRPSEIEAEEDIRSYDATQNWIKDGKRPYALALPGTSGSPVFVHIKKNRIEKVYLLGLISSFAHISGTFNRGIASQEAPYILMNQRLCLNQYLTIFSLPYKTTMTDEGTQSRKAYIPDPVAFSMIQAAHYVASQHPAINHIVYEDAGILVVFKWLWSKVQSILYTLGL